MRLECHITLDGPAQFQAAKKLGEEYGFHFSKINGDEEMGPGIKGYLTRSSNKEFNFEFHAKLLAMCERLEFAGIHWARRKIESIIVDERNS